MKSLIICLMGPTASGKTPLAMELVQHFPMEIISVDSVMVYRGMDIGTAKPSPAELTLAPHRLIDFLDPIEHYSAGQFQKDALQAIESIIANKKIPLLVGGTMLYFRVLQQGIAPLPIRDEALRQELQQRAEREGWEALHRWLSEMDEEASHRIHPHDSQRIQRALEVCLLTGKPLSHLQKEATTVLENYQVLTIAMAPFERERLHQRIAARFQRMLSQGFVEEVESLYQRGDLHAQLPSIRAVGYRQAWDYLEGLITKEEMHANILAATRQLAKRQLTWLRSWPEQVPSDANKEGKLKWYDSETHRLTETVIRDLEQVVSHFRG